MVPGFGGLGSGVHTAARKLETTRTAKKTNAASRAAVVGSMNWRAVAVAGAAASSSFYSADERRNLLVENDHINTNQQMAWLRTRQHSGHFAQLRPLHHHHHPHHLRRRLHDHHHTLSASEALRSSIGIRFGPSPTALRWHTPPPNWERRGRLARRVVGFRECSNRSSNGAAMLRLAGLSKITRENNRSHNSNKNAS